MGRGAGGYKLQKIFINHPLFIKETSFLVKDLRFKRRC